MKKYKVIDKYDFSDGKQIEKEEVKKMRKDVLKHLKNNNSSYYFLNTGNTIILGVKNDDNIISIYECSSGFKEYTYEKI